ncbi:MAG: LysR family transcriptional regulator [Proteobacteria bacterium]|nr:LysR family transcriptional regulator [Pseudomonadota bacterium]
MTALPSLKQLQYLVALAQQLNFTRAAQSCFVTQSTLSAGLKELEAVLGAQLVERDRQSVLMTPLGLDVADRARAIIAATQDLSERAAQTQQPMSGPLRLGVIPTIAPFLLPPSLALLRQRYADLRLALREDLTAHLLSRIDDGQLDFALIALPYATGNFLVETLFDDALWIVGRHDDALLQGTTVKPAPALADRLLLLEEGHCLREHALYACGGPVRPSVVEATSLLTLVQMVESGLGVALIPAMAVSGGLTQSKTLVSRPLSPPAPKRTIALVARRSTSRLADLKALAEVIRQAYRAMEKR